MGYYATLEDWNIYKARISDIKKFEEERKEQCFYGFSPENLIIKFGENGEIESFEFEEIDTKWYDQEEFSKLLSRYLVEGLVQFWFIGEDAEKWTWTAVNNAVLDGDWLKFSPDVLCMLIKNSNNHTKKMLVKEYIEHWRKMLEEAKDKLEGIKGGCNG